MQFFAKMLFVIHVFPALVEEDGECAQLGHDMPSCVYWTEC